MFYLSIGTLATLARRFPDARATVYVGNVVCHDLCSFAALLLLLLLLPPFFLFSSFSFSLGRRTLVLCSFAHVNALALINTETKSKHMKG